jgi:hypothetical protein
MPSLLARVRWVVGGSDLVLIGPRGERLIVAGLNLWQRIRWALGLHIDVPGRP